MTLAPEMDLSSLPCPPLFGTPRSPDRPTLGGQVAVIAARLGRPLMAHQRYIADVALEIDPQTGLLAYDQAVVIGPRQATGKALDVETPIWTDRGWLPIGDVSVGDHVYHPDGHPVLVTFASEVMHGHDCYRVVTSDGRAVVADAEHLWTVRDTYSGGQRPQRILTTKEIATLGLRNRGRPGGARFRLPIQRAVKSPEVSLPLHPYLLGLWLGDGSTYKAEVTSADPEVFKAFDAAGFRPSYSYPAGAAVTRGLLGLFSVLRGMGVLRNKHVPANYLTAGHDQRLSLLQGLLDTDGCITANHSGLPRIEFTSTKRRLAEAVLFLARSLGWRASILSGRAKLGGRDCGPKWTVAFTATRDDPPPFRLDRKLAKVGAPLGRTGQRTAVSIVAIEAVPSRPVRCLKVASPDGLFLAGRDLVATHNTELLLPVMTHRCIGFGPALTKWIRETLGVAPPEPGPQTVVYTAQTADLAREKWRDIHVARLQKSVYRDQFHPRLTTNQEAMLWRNRSVWRPRSTTGKTAGTGDSIDVAVIDEAWSKQDSKTELGLRPAMMTRDWKQLWITSMIPGLSRALPGEWSYLANKRKMGRARVAAGMRHGTAFFDWAAPPGLDPGDPATWWLSLPGLGQTVQERAIASDFADMSSAGNLVDFCAEYLGWAPDPDDKPRWTVITESTWNGLHDPHSQIAGPPAFALEFNQERTRARIGASGRRPDGNWHIEVVEPGDKIRSGTSGVSWATPRLIEMCQKQNALGVVIDPSRPARSEIPALRNAGIEVITPNHGDIAGACGRFYDRTGQEVGEYDTGERLLHLDQPELRDALAEVRKWDHGLGAFTFVAKKTDGDLGDLYVCVLAMHGAEVLTPEPEVDPDIFFGGDDSGDFD